ncbi:MraZ protein [Ereboglobus sp. PH5-5]|uniref:division/cell wall cluster transcriptional repressor MraZ n=1 Tax=unclassified Ereboglobus TaxID=2626932 RepID=UPI0024062E18|nr:MULTISPECIES: mraZ [unclassified Ereboglobus]MDF9825995.1 MraZ protein [Ereboglobus sp. PH5-10]MDF9833250.1 MraZ protein [Ereboglobus sp. PH5-5]
MTPQGTAVYSGEYRHALDDKNRLTIPSPWRTPEAIGVSFLAVPQHDDEGNRFIAVLTPAKVASIHAKSDQIPISNVKGRQALARFFSKSKDFSYDKQGRAAISPEHCEHAGITRDAVLVGSMDNFFIYSPETWARISKPEADDNSVLAQLGI